jgi:hypothetical protein
VGKNDVKTYTNTPLSVFFNINKATIASRKDLVNVKNLAEYAKDNKVNLVVTGYADSSTGSAAYNKKLQKQLLTNSLRWALAATRLQQRVWVVLRNSHQFLTTVAPLLRLPTNHRA